MKNWNNFLRFILCFLTANALFIPLMMGVAFNFSYIPEIISILMIMFHFLGLTYLLEFLIKEIREKKRQRN
jgi:surface polysaccharide O-acyltransferase-like enzyme